MSPAVWAALFLNEGFATKMEFIGADHFSPAFEAGRQFLASDVVPAMEATQYGASRALVPAVVDSSATIESLFDGVSYSFGASLLRMIEGHVERVSPGSYFGAIRSYMASKAFGVAVADDLWSAFATSAGQPSLAANLAGWTSQIGYPLLTVAWVDGVGGGEATGVGALSVSQSRHFYSAVSAAAAPAGTRDTLWWVPLSLAATHPGDGSPVPAAAAAALADGGFTTRTWSRTIRDATTPYNLARDGPVKLNLNATAFHRVAYPASLWLALASAANTSAVTGGPLSTDDRGNLMDDVWTLGEGGVGGVNLSLALAYTRTAMRFETAYEAWLPALRHLGRLRMTLTADADGAPTPADCAGNLQVYASALLTPAINALGIDAAGNDTSSPLRVQLRSAVLSTSAAFGVAAASGPLLDLWTAYAGGAGPLPRADLQAVVFATAVRLLGTPAWDSLWTLYRNPATDAGTARRALTAIASASDATLLSRALGVALNASLVRSQDTVSVISTVAAQPAGRSLAWAWVKANWAALMARYGGGGFALSNLVSSTASPFNSEASAADIVAWYAVNPVPGAVVPLAIALENVRTRAAWLQSNDLAGVCSWLQQPL